MELKKIEEKSEFILRFLSLLFMMGVIWFFFKKNNILLRSFKKEYIFFNFFLAIVVLLTYFLMGKFNKIFYSPITIFILSFAFFIVPVKRDLSLCGDAHEWISLSTTKILYGSETLPHFGRYLFIHFLKPIGVPVDKSFGYFSSLFGILSLFSFFFLSRSLYKESDLRKFFFCGTLTFSSQGFFFRYPENSFLAIPFLILALKSAIEFLFERKEMYIINTFLYSLFLSLAILFHGFSLFFLPAFLVLPFLKRFSLRKSLYTIILTIFIVFSSITITILILNLLSFPFNPHHARVFIGQTYPFVDFLGMSKYHSLKIDLFSEVHLSGIILAIFLSFPSIIFIIPLTFLKFRIKDKDLIFLILALCSLIFLIIWNPDLGIWRDIDLFVTPSTFISLLYLKKVIDSTKGREFLQPMLLFIFSFFSGIPYILFRR